MGSSKRRAVGPKAGLAWISLFGFWGNWSEDKNLVVSNFLIKRNAKNNDARMPVNSDETDDGSGKTGLEMLRSFNDYQARE